MDACLVWGDELAYLLGSQYFEQHIAIPSITGIRVSPKNMDEHNVLCVIV